MSSFESSYKVPSHIPQDLLLIHDLVGRDVPSSSSTLPASDKVKIKAKEDSIESSGDEGFDSEDEVEANLLQEEDEDMDGKTSILYVHVPFPAQHFYKRKSSTDQHPRNPIPIALPLNQKAMIYPVNILPETSSWGSTKTMMALAIRRPYTQKL